MKITVVGLGKIGLPLAVQFASRGHQVLGADVNARTVETINSSHETFPGAAHLQEKLVKSVGAGLLKAMTDTAAAVAQSDVVVAVIPLFVDLDGFPDFGWMDSASKHIARGVKPGTLVAYETILPVGTTRKRWKPVLEQGSGLTEGADFDLVFSPERVLIGRVFTDLRKYPKLVGGFSDEGAKRAMAFYEDVLELDDRPDLERGNGVWDLGSAEAVAIAKLAETIYRDVNIGLANQFGAFTGQDGDRRLPRHRGQQLPAVQPHPPARHRRRRPLHPGLPAPLPVSLGFEPHAVGSEVDLAILQSDHAAYRDLSADDTPGVKVVVDGRGVLHPATFPDAKLLVVGKPRSFKHRTSRTSCPKGAMDHD